MKNLIVASTSTIHGGEYLDYLLQELETLFENTEEIVFIPFARPSGISHEQYTDKAAKTFAKIGKKLVGIHEYADMKQAISSAKGIFTGGGNTFLLVSQLYRYGLIELLREVLHAGVPYLGTSAGSNICGLNMQTTNDMPIVYPPSFKTLGVIPFNINPHYLDPIPNSTHMGETRETRINEFHTQNNVLVVGLREGSWLKVVGSSISLRGNLTARIFQQGQSPFELDSGSSLDELFN